MWVYLELLLFVVGFFMAYRAGWQSGWTTALRTTSRAVEELIRQQQLEALKPKRKVEPSPLSEEEKQPLDD